MVSVVGTDVFRFAPCPGPCCEEIELGCPGGGVIWRACVESMPNIITMDLGVGGWTDQACNRCDEVAGEYDMIFQGIFGVNNTGVWEYLDENYCGNMQLALTLNVRCKPGFPGPTIDGSVVVCTKESPPSGFCAFVGARSDAFYDGTLPSGSCPNSGTHNLGNKIESHAGACGATLPNLISITM